MNCNNLWPGLFQKQFFCHDVSKSLLQSLVCNTWLELSLGLNLTCAAVCDPAPNPCLFGRRNAQTGFLIPDPSRPSPMPGVQPMLCNILLPMLVSGIGSQNSPIKPGINRISELLILKMSRKKNCEQKTPAKYCKFTIIYKNLTNNILNNKCHALWILRSADYLLTTIAK